MAASVITGAVWPAYPTARLGPYSDGSGNLWVIALNASNQATAYKSTNQGLAWTAVASYTTTALSGGSLDSQADNPAAATVITVLGQDSTHKLVILKFTIGSASWARFDSGTAPTVGADASGLYPAFLAVRSTGSVVVVYQFPIAPTYRRVYVAVTSTTGVWGSGTGFLAPTEVDAGGNYHYDVKCAALGALDRVHILYDAERYADPYHRSLAGPTDPLPNSLDSAVSLRATTILAADYYSIFYNPTLARVITSGAITGSVNQAPQRTIQDSQTNNGWLSDTNVVGSDTPSAAATVFSYDSVGSTLVAFFRDTASADLYYNSTATTTWTPANAAVQDVATAVTGISVSPVRLTATTISGIGVLYKDTSVYFDWSRRVSVGPAQKLIACNTASETDSSQLATWNPKNRLVAVGSEGEAAQAIVHRKIKAVASAVEIGTAQITASRKLHAAGNASEADAVQAISKRKIHAAGQSAEVGLAQAVTHRKVKAVSTASENALASAIIHPVGGIQLAQETDSAKAIHVGLNRLVNTISDTEVAQSIARRKVRTVGQVSESDSAALVKAAKAKAVGQTTESNVAQGMTRRKIKSIAFLTETDAAQTTAIRKARAVAQSTEIESAQTVAKRKIKTVGTAGETDASQIISLKGKIIVAVGTASEVDASQSVKWAPKRRIVSSATETDTAQSLTKVHFKAIGRASEVETAPAVNRQKVKQVSTIAETNTSQAVRIQKSYQIDTAAEANSAPAATRRVAGTYDVHTASEVDAAFSITARRVFPIVRAHPAEPTLVTNGTPLRSRLSEPNRRTNGEPILTSELEPILD